MFTETSGLNTLTMHADTVRATDVEISQPAGPANRWCQLDAGPPLAASVQYQTLADRQTNVRGEYINA